MGLAKQKLTIYQLAPNHNQRTLRQASNMQLRNGKNTDKKERVFCPVLAQRDIATILAKFREAFSEPDETFVDSLVKFEQVFTAFNENFSTIIQPWFPRSDRFLAIVREKISYWNTNIAQKFFNCLMENPEIATKVTKQVQKTQGLIRHTETLLANIPF